MRFIVGLGLLLTAASFLPGLASAETSSFLVGADSTTQYGDPAHLSAQLLIPCGFSEPNICPFGGAQVDFYVDGAYVGTDTTDAGGFADLLASSPDWHVGAHVITAHYDRNTYPPSAASVDSVLTVVQEVTGTVAQKGYFQASLTDDEGAPLVNAPVRFHIVRTFDTPAGPQTFDHDVCTAFTDAAGLAKCIPVTGIGVTPLNDDHTQYTATFDGMADYVASSGSANFL